jgi:6-phosphogluconate dehydrogenase (decarboxylating)
MQLGMVGSGRMGTNLVRRLSAMRQGFGGHLEKRGSPDDAGAVRP